jgi:cell division protein FtsW (lipid II flippase)
MDNVSRNERNLLMVSSLILIAGIMAVSLAHGAIDYTAIGAAVGLTVSWFLVHIFLRTTGHSGDSLLLPLATLLISIGLTMIFRLNPKLFLPQVISIIIGLVVFCCSVVFFRRLESLTDYKYICGFIGVMLLLTAIVFGVDIGGHKSWVIIGPLRFQPSEFAKLFIVLFLAAYLNERRELLSLATKQYGPFSLPHPRFIAPLLTVWGLTMVMFVLQRDMGSALLYFGVIITMTYMVSGKQSYVFLGVILFLIGSFICYKLYAHIQIRVDIWLNPWQDPNGKAYQIVQSLFALGSGGILGSGLTYGFPVLIPEVHTDFIFAAIGEELGLMGTGAVLMAYMLMIYRFFRISLKTAFSFSMLAAGGLAVVMSLQVFLIIAGVTKFFPLTGITLPFISYGGSSVVSNFILLGMLFAISETRPEL